MNIISSQELDERSEEPESEVKSKERFTLPKPKPPKTGREVKSMLLYYSCNNCIRNFEKML